MIFDSLKNFDKLHERYVVGLISGTSADGIDVAVCKISDKDIAIVSYSTYPYNAETKCKIQKASSLTLQEIAELDVVIGSEFAKASLQEVILSKVPCIHLIGSHGQTIYHHSRVPNSKKVSLQLGCGDTIAVTTGSPVVFDFRRKDTALGGEGAPLTPYGDFRLFKDRHHKRVILNLGGISNISVLGEKVEDVYGFDCGPANAPLDRIVDRLTDGVKRYDHNGDMARSGTVNEKLLKHLLSTDPFFVLSPPKSTGFESYGDGFVDEVIKLHGRLDIDLLSTITAFISKIIADSVRRYVKIFPDEIIVAGGGAKNSFLLEILQKDIAPCVVKISDALGVPGDAREAASFAIMAHDFVLGLDTSLPKVTGAARGASLGKLAFP